MLQLQTEDASIQIVSIKTYVVLFGKEMINEKITSLILVFLMFICCISNVGAVNIYATDTSEAMLGDKITTFSVISPQSNEDGSGDIGGTGLTAGDVLITNGTSFDGITGHAAIVVSPTEILHISGPGEKPKVVPKDEWMNEYLSKGWVKVFRHENNTVARKAAKWARETYENSNASYFLTPRFVQHKLYLLFQNCLAGILLLERRQRSVFNMAGDLYNALRPLNKYKGADVCIQLHTEIIYDIENLFENPEDYKKSP